MKNKFEEYIREELNKILPENKIKDAVLYCIEGGKRFRPALIFSILKGFGLNEELAYPFALSIELVHSSSLILDDLPCMDDDDFRRGKPSVHRKFNEYTAILSSSSMFFDSFLIISNSNVDDKIKNQIIKEFSIAAGSNGIMTGQLLDIENEKKLNSNLVTLNKIQDYKTGSLFKLSFLIGMFLVGDSKNRAFYETMGLKIGRIFQMQDDLFEIIKTSEEIGKPVNSDFKNNKMTTLNFYDKDELQKILKKEFCEVKKLLKRQSFNTSFLEEIVNKMENR